MRPTSPRGDVGYFYIDIENRSVQLPKLAAAVEKNVFNADLYPNITNNSAFSPVTSNILR